MVEQRAVTVGDRLKPLEEMSKQPHVKGVEFGLARQLVRVVLVMRQRMMGIRNTDLRIRPQTQLTHQHECRNSGEIRLIGERLKIEQEPGMLFERVRNAEGRYGRKSWDRLRILNAGSAIPTPSIACWKSTPSQWKELYGVLL